MDDSGIVAAGWDLGCANRIQLGGITVIPGGESGFCNRTRL
jgi:hypothetical protein